MERTLFAGALMMLAGGAASAEPGTLPPKPEVDEHVRILAPPTGACAPRGGWCFHPAAPTTVAMGSAEVAGAGPVSSVMRLGRAAPAGRDAPWRIRLEAALKRPAWNGNALLVIYDAADPEAIARHEVTALYQTRLRAGATVAADLELSPVEGVCPGHTYRIRLVQLVGGKEVMLAEGDVTLL